MLSSSSGGRAVGVSCSRLVSPFLSLPDGVDEGEGDGLLVDDVVGEGEVLAEGLGVLLLGAAVGVGLGDGLLLAVGSLACVVAGAAAVPGEVMACLAAVAPSTEYSRSAK